MASEHIQKRIEEKLAQFKADSSAKLWVKCRYFMCEIDIFCLVKTLLSRCSSGIKTGFFPRDASYVLVALIGKSEKPEVLMMICGLLSLFCNSLSTAKVELVNRNVLFELTSLIRSCFSEKDQASRKQKAIKKNYNSIIYRQEELIRKTDLSEKITSLFVYFSLGPRPCFDGFVFEGAVQLMTDLLDWRNAEAYPTTARAKHKTEELLLGKTLVASKETMRMESIRNRYRVVFGFEKEASAVQVFEEHQPLVLEMYDTTDPVRDVNIQEELYKAGFIWHNAHIDVDTSSDSVWTDITVQTVISPAQFWVLLGADTLDFVNEIRSRLVSDMRQENLLSEKPSGGDLIVVGKDDQGPYRACVLGYIGEKVKVISLDYGFIKCVQVKWLFELDDALKHIPPQAVYCELKGVMIPPRSNRLTENLLSVFCNLAGESHIAESALNNRGVLTTLMSWAFGENRAMSLKALRTLCNLARSASVREMLGDLGLLTATLDLCKSLHDDLDLDLVPDILEAALCLLDNLIFENTLNKERLIQAEGVESLVLQNLSQDQIPERIRIAATKVLRVFVGYAKLQSYCTQQKSPRQQSPRQQSPRQQSPRKQQDQRSKPIIDSNESERKTPQNSPGGFTASESGESPVSAKSPLTARYSQQPVSPLTDVNKELSSNFLGAMDDLQLTGSDFDTPQVRAPEHPGPVGRGMGRGTYIQNLIEHRPGSLEIGSVVDLGSNAMDTEVMKRRSLDNSLPIDKLPGHKEKRQSLDLWGQGDRPSDQSTQPNSHSGLKNPVLKLHLPNQSVDKKSAEQETEKASSKPRSRLELLQEVLRQPCDKEQSRMTDAALGDPHDKQWLPGDHARNGGVNYVHDISESSLHAGLCPSHRDGLLDQSEAEDENSTKPGRVQTKLTWDRDAPSDAPSGEPRILATSRERGCPDGGDEAIPAVRDAGTRSKNHKTQARIPKLSQTKAACLYVKDDHVNFTSDETHELRTETSIDVKEGSLAEQFISLLNNGHKATIYFGLRRGKVIGIQANRDQKDKFRIGMDGMIQKRIKPLLMPSAYKVQFFQVYQKLRNKPEAMEPIKDRYVIEISTEVTSGLFSYEGKVYFREGADVFKGDASDIRKRAIQAEEDKHLKDVAFLEKEIERLKTSMKNKD